MGEGNYEIGHAKYFCPNYFPSDILHAIKSYDIGPRLYFPSEGRRMLILSPLTIHHLSRV
jgi:hypothetical protein